MADNIKAVTSGAGPGAKPPNVCFGCGEANVGGMHLPFSRDEAARRVIGEFRLGDRYQGAPGIVHGGIVALVLDEALSKVSKFFGLRAVTAELQVEYLRPVRTGQDLRVEASNERCEGAHLYHFGEIRDTHGRVLARAKGRFVAVNVDRFLAANKETGK
ncbi:MAG TPA: PaaI family thioesterase [Candidatus Acidoferrales bacterium]|nr:PaaI family thioesterase [Candidatus Acidoferrales bacterium]